MKFASFCTKEKKRKLSTIFWKICSTCDREYCFDNVMKRKFNQWLSLIPPTSIKSSLDKPDQCSIILHGFPGKCMVCSSFFFTNILSRFSRSYLEIHKQKRKSKFAVTSLWGVLVLHDIKLPNQTDTIPVLDNENKATSFYMNLI